MLRLTLLTALLLTTHLATAQDYDTLRTTLYFSSDSDRLDAEQAARLDTFYLQREAYDGKPQFIARAHTDAQGSLTYNQNLATRRALHIQERLLALGASPLDIKLVTYGEVAPVADNALPDGRRQNRRVELLMLLPIQPPEAPPEPVVALPEPTVPLSLLQGQVVDAKSGSPLSSATVVVRGLRFDTTLVADATGRFEIELPYEGRVGITAYSNCYLSATQEERIATARPTTTLLKLPPIEQGLKVDLENMYFYGGRDVLLPESVPSLKRLLATMERNPGLYIKVNGHINRPGTRPENLPRLEYELSVNRAKRVRAYLIDNGIATKRVEYEGFGNEQMVYPNARSEAQQAANRRVELEVLKIEDCDDSK